MLGDTAKLDSVYQLHGYSSPGGRLEIPKRYTNATVASWCTKKSDH